MALAGKLPSLEHLIALFNYNPKTGLLIRAKTVRGRGSVVGAIVGTPNSDGHLVCKIDYQIYYVHRIIWKIFYGEEPPPILDHKNRKNTDNRIDNLRPATAFQNGCNKNISKRNLTGIVGVSFCKQMKRWKSHIKANGINIHLGYHHKKEDAITARRKAERKLHKEYAHSNV